MRTKHYILIAMALISLNAHALIYYVDGSKADDTGNAFSWANAKKTIGAVLNLNLTSADTVFVKAGTYLFAATSGTALSTYGTKPVNLYGGFAGTEGKTTQRARSDKDGNGTIDPWEFTNETVLSFNVTDANGLGLFSYQSAISNLNGFIITGLLTNTITGTVAGKSAIGIYGNWNFRNNTVRNWSINVSLNATGTTNANADGSLLKVYAGGTTTLFGNCTIDNCLIEKNSSIVTATSVPNSDNRQAPLIRIPGSNGADLGANTLKNTVIRNNKAKVDYSAATLLTSNIATKGFVLDLAPGGKSDGTVAAPTVVKNNLIYNNDAEFVATYNATQAGIVGALSATTVVSDSVLNNTIANNKLTKLSAALSIATGSATQPYHKVINNAVFNNTNYDGSNTIQANIDVAGTAPDNSTAGMTIFNNICSGGATNLSNNSSNTATTNIFGNLIDMATTNTGTNAPYFISPTSLIGTNRVAGSADSIAIAQSNWKINSQSYLTGKGIITTNKTDKAGILFNSSNPSVGAYEGNRLSFIWAPAYIENQFVKVKGHSIYVDVNAAIEVYDAIGRIVIPRTIQNPVELNQHGVFIVRTTVSNLQLVQKIIIY